VELLYTKEFANEIGADAYAYDAGNAVECSKKSYQWSKMNTIL